MKFWYSQISSDVLEEKLNELYEETIKLNGGWELGEWNLISDLKTDGIHFKAVCRNGYDKIKEVEFAFAQDGSVLNNSGDYIYDLENVSKKDLIINKCDFCNRYFDNENLIIVEGKYICKSCRANEVV